MARIGLVTCDQFRELATDDDLLVEALLRRGHVADRPAWHDSSVVWPSYDILIIRSTWDYQYRLTEFLQWVAKIERLNIPLHNPPAVLRWNSSKSYLRDLSRKGVPIPATTWIENGREFKLSKILTENGWLQAVVKPMVGAGAFFTYQVSREDADQHEANDVPELRERGALVQEFLPEIITDGEWSLLFFGNEFSHAVIKLPKAGDFRVQEHHGGSYQAAQPDPAIIHQARRVLIHAPAKLLYARVDGIVRNGMFLLIELEAFEPWFFLTYSEGATDRFLQALEQTTL